MNKRVILWALVGVILGLIAGVAYILIRYAPEPGELAVDGKRDREAIKIHEDLLPLPTQIKWEAPQEKIYEEYYDRDNLNERGYPTTIPLVGYELASQNSGSSYDLGGYYDEILSQKGWEQLLAVSADGPMGSVWGYTRGSEYMIFESHTKYLEPQPKDRPVECPCEYRYTVFVGTER